MYGCPFSVFTDNNPLTYVLSTAKLDATGHRWLAELATFNFDLSYRAGRMNIDADALSRIPRINSHIPVEVTQVNKDVVSAVCQISCPNTFVETLCMENQLINPLSNTPLSACSRPDWIIKQREDPLLKQAIDHLKGTKLISPQMAKANPFLSNIAQVSRSRLIV